MPRLLGLRKIIMVILILISISSCAAHHNKIEAFYIIPAVTYLRECPNYDCPVVAEIYNSDSVTVLYKKEGGWWQVQSGRDQKIGWAQRDLLSPTPIMVETYYITGDGLTLRNSPAEDAVSRIPLAYGEKVQKIAEQNGWWRVAVEKDKSMGWIPAARASADPPGQPGMQRAPLAEGEKTGSGSSQARPAARPDYYFVAAETLKLHLIPSDSSNVVKILKLNDKVDKISQSGSGWFKVRYLETGAEGWAPVRYLKDSPVTEIAQIVQKKKMRRKKPPQPKQQVQDPGASKTLEPEAM